MTEQDAIRNLMAHFMHRLNEFFDQNKAEEIKEEELGYRFARWLYGKDGRSQPFKTQTGVIAQAFNSEEVADGESFTMARLVLFKEHGVGLMWMGELFGDSPLAMPDELREMTVRLLRFHADRLETREMDERMKQVYKSGTGAA